MRGQNQIYGVEIIALAILIILAVVIYAEMNALCRENHLGVVLITWINLPVRAYHRVQYENSSIGAAVVFLCVLFSSCGIIFFLW